MGQKGRKSKKSSQANSKQIEEQSHAVREEIRKQLEEKASKIGVSTATKVSGGIRMNRPKKFGHDNLINQKKLLDNFLSKYRYINVNNPIQRIGIFLMNQKQITIQTPNQNPSAKFSHIRYLQEFNCFVIDLHNQKIEETLFTESPPTIGERIAKRQERKFKEEIVKKCKLFKENVASVIFDLPSEFWQFMNPELYVLDKCYYVLFADMQVGRKMTPEEAAAREALKEISTEKEEIPNLVSITPEDNIEEHANLSDTNLQEAGFAEEDIQIVMQESHINRSAAIEALQKHNGDIVNAIMGLL